MHDASSDDDAADVRDANALLLALNAVGIPVLVRALGEAHAPPSATVGVLGALFHAATKPSGACTNAPAASRNARTVTALQALATPRRAIAYHGASQDLLLVLTGDAPLVSADAARVLESVGAALALLLGAQCLEALDAARQRVALARHAETLDRIVQQRIWFRGGVVVAEHTASSCNLTLDAAEIVVLALLGEKLAARGLREARQAMRVGCSSDGGGSIANVAIEVSQSEDTSCIGVFSEDATDCEVQQEMDRMQEGFGVPTEVPSSIPDELLGKLPLTFVGGYASRLHGGAASPSCRTIRFLNPNWKDVWAGVQLSKPPLAADPNAMAGARGASSAKEEAVWRTLCEFVAKRLDVAPRVSSRSNAPRLLDYKREDEFFTLLHHTRGLLQFFSISVGSLSLQQTTSVGDMLHEYFSWHQE